MPDAREDLSCRELVEIVTDYLEGALAPGERARFEAHLAACDGCEAYMRQMRDTVATLGALCEDDPARPAVLDDLLAAFRRWKRA